MAGYGNFDFFSPPPPPDYDTTTPPPPSSASASASSSSSSAASASAASSSSASTSASSSTSSDTKLVIGIGVGIGIPVLLIAVAFFVIWFKRKRRHALSASSDTLPKSQQYCQQNASPPTRDTIPLMMQIPASVDSSFGPAGQQYWQQNASRSTRDTSPMLQRPVSVGSGFGSKTTFTYEELSKATNDFSADNFLGQGGFGCVYKGVLPKVKEVAIKKLKFGSQQGDREFRAEIETISRLHHKHLVFLAGYCISGTHRLLVYQFVPNKTLKFHLHEKDSPPLKWEMRMKIALGSAKGLTYLHEDCDPKIIHRDIKSANILLDYSFEAKVADFGLARFNSDTQTHLSIAAAGTKGYIAPECSNGKITEKSDVYSFGVVLLELITGRQPTGEEAQYIVDWAKPLLTKALEDNNFDTLADPRLQKDYNSVEMARMVTCAATCLRHSAQHRPRMSQIVRALEVNVSLDDLSEGIRPGHSITFSTSHESTDYVKAEDSKKFRKMASGSQERGASDGSGTNPSASNFFP
ncbi:proline-rich receptor-like protein kinase PERK1 [Cornus florida]|uniref:proline-rich receptor-like protein kinase PERK1 n=1 Tax=Cornus florida TaxID=4283 RepID=UPI0028A122CE|nr:proline-rich receptor-like protein kinase PERK1 [Cornus florida]